LFFRRALSEFDKALDFQAQSLSITQRIEDTPGEILVLSAIGNTYMAKGELAKAIDYQLRSLKAAETAPNQYLQSFTLGNLGQAYMLSGEYGNAIKSYERCLEIVRSVSDRRGEAQALGNLGNIYHFLGHYSKSADYREQMLAIMRQLQDKMSISQALANLGVSYLTLGEQEKAFACLQESLQLKREVFDRRGEAIVLGNLALYYNLAKNDNKAQECQMQSLRLAREINYTYGEVHTLVALGVIYYSKGLYSQSMECFQEALPIVRKMGEHRFEAVILENLGRILFQTGQTEESEKMLWAGIEILESLRDSLGFDDANKISLFDTQQNTYHLLQKVLVAQGKANTALEVAERARARAFIELLRRQNASFELSFQAEASPTIEQIRKIAKAQEATLVEYSLVYINSAGKAQEPTLDLYIWVIHPTGKIDFQNIDWSSHIPEIFNESRSLNSEFFDAMGVRGRGVAMESSDVADTEVLQEIYRQLIYPVASFLPEDEKHRIIFIPQFFTFVPFPALMDENGKYLIEKHTILTAPSIQVLDLTHKQKHQLSPNAESETLVIGNPTMPKIQTKKGTFIEQLDSLPHAEQEAREIARLLRIEPFIGEHATKAEVLPKMRKAYIIHLATHGLLDDFSKTEIPGAVALAPSDTDNGLLTAEEILSLDLQADLVVLSACSTAHGRMTGDGVIGLAGLEVDTYRWGD
ncbi:MAG: CHAT domain-containing protein, partial [Phaeodactylibacter sp.]|nr:CHAT domain-containing protein [Phaeodactylibacter sp.]